MASLRPIYWRSDAYGSDGSVAFRERKPGYAMPMITVSLRKPKSREFKINVLDSLYASLIAAGFDERDRFYRVLELDADDFGFDPTFPDVLTRRDDNFV